MSGVTTTDLIILSSAGGSRTLPCVNREEALSRISNATTAAAGAPSATTTNAL
jgi:hypothetical protein